MTSTIQKKIKFSKGCVAPDLIERTDLQLLDASALEMTNYTATIYGGFRTRQGTKYITGEVGSAFNDVIQGRVVQSLGAADHVFDDEEFTSDEIGTNRVLCEITYDGANTNGGYLFLNNLRSSGGVMVVQETAGGGHKSLYKGLYDIIMTGGGAGSYASGSTGGTNRCWGDTGGSGAGFAGRLYLEGWYQFTVGKAGYANTKGEDTLFVGSDGKALITAGGGLPGASGNLYASGGAGGTISVDTTPEQIYLKANGNPGSGAYYYHSGSTTAVGAKSVLYDKYQMTYGASTTITYSHGTRDMMVSGSGGYLQIKTVYCTIPLIVEASKDGQTYEEVGRFDTSGESKNLRYFWIEPGLNYVRIMINEQADVNIPDTISFSNIKLFKATPSDVQNDQIRLEKFIFNDQEKYLLVLTNENIMIYHNDVLHSNVVADGLAAAYLADLKVAQKEDTMIFCHPDMPPKQLQRTIENDKLVFKWTDFELENPPYYAFDGEIKTNKTIGIKPNGAEGSVTLTADSAVFAADNVGQYIDGGGGRFRITRFESSTKVAGYTIIPFYTDEKISSWTLISGYETAWSETRGWPRCCLFAGSRLWFGGSKSRPATLFGSRVNLYNDFKNAGNYDNDSIVADLLTVSPIVNLGYNRGIHIFTTGEEWTVSEASLTPNAFSATINTQNGSYGAVRPCVLGGLIVFVERNGKSLLTYVYDYNQAAYKTDDISLLSNLIEKPMSMDAQINSSVDKGDFLFMTLSNGTMLVNTLSLSQGVKALSLFKTNGLIKDVCVLRDETYILVKRGTFYYVEKLGDYKTDCQQDIFIKESQVSGLHMYGGNRVHVWSDAHDYGECLVSEGGIMMLSEIPNELCHIGLTFDCKLASNYLEVGGSSSSIKKRIARAIITTKDTDRVQLNGVMKKGDKDGIFQFMGVSGYKRTCQFVIESRFYPLNILSITLFMNYGRFE